MTLPFHVRPAKLNADFAILLLILVGLNVPFWTIRFLPSADTISANQFFQFFYGEWLFNHEFPRWMPYNLYGIPVDYWVLTSLSPAQYFVALVGQLFDIRNTFRLFEASIFLEETALLVGTYLLSRRLFRHRLTVFFVCIGVIGTVIWTTQVWFNFRLYYLLPFILFFIIRCFDTSDFRYLWIAGIVTTVSLIGNLPYFAPLYAMVLAIFIVVMLVGRKRSIQPAWPSLFRSATLVYFGLFCVCACLYLRFVAHVFDHTMAYPPGRDPSTMQVDFKTFSTYAVEPSLTRLLELFYAIPVRLDTSFYIGLLPLVFLVVALLRVKEVHFRAILVTAAVLILLGASYLAIVTPLVYALPLMNRFRHIGLVLSMAKLLLLIASGFGVDALLSGGAPNAARVPRRLFRLPLRIGAALALGVVLMDAVAFRGHFPYKPSYQVDLSGYFHAFEFHYVALAALASFLFAWYRWARSDLAKAGRILVGCYLFEIASYQFYLFMIMPGTVSAQAVHLFTVHPCPFQEQRVDYRLFLTKIPGALEIYEKLGPGYCLFDSFLGVDAALPYLRHEFLPIGVDRLVRARLGVELDNPRAEWPPGTEFVHTAPRPPAKDLHLLNCLGSGAPKLRLETNVQFAASLAEAARMVHDTPNLDELTVLRDPSPGAKPTAYAKVAPAARSLNEGPHLGTIELDWFSANELELKVQANPEGGAWLIYADSYHPGWRAFVDGQPSPIQEADLAFKAIKIEKGLHDVWLRFVGEGFGRANLVSLVTLGVLSVFWLLAMTVALLGWTFPGVSTAVPAKHADQS